MDRMAQLRGLRRTPLELLLLLVLELCAVSSDLTDGNTEHLKRDHSLTKPYHGELPRLAPLASLPEDAAPPSVCQTIQSKTHQAPMVVWLVEFQYGLARQLCMSLTVSIGLNVRSMCCGQKVMREMVGIRQRTYVFRASWYYLTARRTRVKYTNSLVCECLAKVHHQRMNSVLLLFSWLPARRFLFFPRTTICLSGGNNDDSKRWCETNSV